MFHSDVYKNRRKNLIQKLDSGVVLLLGNIDVSMNYPANTYRFRQDSNFLYFFGLDVQNLIGMIDIDSGQEILFGDNLELDDIIWMGPQESIQEKGLKVGVASTKPRGEIFAIVEKMIQDGRKIHFIPPYRTENKLFLDKLLGIKPSYQKQYASIPLIKSIVSLREIKEEVEIVELEIAANIGYEMHLAAMKACKPGISEQKLAGIVEGIALSNGWGVSFPVILTQNGETLHNHYHGNILENGKMLLCDAGAETNMHYASDYTRTYPVSGVFSSRQKDIYNIVLAANNKVTAMLKPGLTYQKAHLEAAKVIASGLKELGLMKGNVDDAVANGAHALFFPHGLGHMMGLDVHDMEDLGENFVGYGESIRRIDQFGTAYLRLGKTLKEGFVLTNEPGIYFIPALISKWESDKLNHDFINYGKVKDFIGFGGIRIEDDILITENGASLIGQRLPSTVDEIEALMNS